MQPPYVLFLKNQISMNNEWILVKFGEYESQCLEVYCDIFSRANSIVSIMNNAKLQPPQKCLFFLSKMLWIHRQIVFLLCACIFLGYLVFGNRYLLCSSFFTPLSAVISRQNPKNSRFWGLSKTSIVLFLFGALLKTKSNNENNSLKSIQKNDEIWVTLIVCLL